MQEWTEGAREALREYLNRLREVLGGDAEAKEVAADVEGHIREEVSRLQCTVVTGDEVRRVLGALGTPDLVASQRLTESYEREPADAQRAPRRGILARLASVAWAWFIYLFVVTFSLLAIILALTSPDFMAEVAIDMFPTVVHPILCTLAVVCVLFGYFWLKKVTRRRWILAILAGGVAIGVSLFYLVVLIPLLPLLAIAVVVGVGLVGLAPLWCLIASIKQTVTYASYCARPEIPGKLALGLLLAIGIVCPVIYLVGYEIHSLEMLDAVEKGALADGSERVDAVRFLRRYAGQETLRRRCYYMSDRSRPTLLSFLLMMNRQRYISVFKYRELFFRVYGEPFNAKPIERLRFGLLQRNAREWQDEWQADAVAAMEQGSEEVGGHVRRLQLEESLIDAFIDAEAAVAYVRWDLTIANNSQRMGEARMKFDVPPHAVAFQMSLRIDGKERHAAFGSTAQVREAYTNVVKQKRDPALLTAKGQGKLMFQLFPVPPDGEMKARVGFMVPLVERGGRQYLSLPRIIERNFMVSNEPKHSVLLDWGNQQAPETLPAPWTVQERSDGTLAIRADLTDKQLVSYTTSTVSLPSTLSGDGHWSTSTDSRGTVTQYRAPLRVGAGAVWAPGGPVMLVVDGSAGCRTGNAQWWRELLAAIPNGTPVDAIFAGDESIPWRGEWVAMNSDNRAALARWLADQEHVGGRDSLPALESALDRIPRGSGGLAIWMHGAVPMELSSMEKLKRLWKFETGLAKLIVFPLAPVPNVVMEKIATDGHGRIAPRLGSAAADFRAALQSLRYAPIAVPDEPAKEAASIRWTGGDVGVLYYRGMPPEGVPFKENVKHLPVLWAKARIDHLFRSKETKKGRALAMNKDYHIVTDHTGAVVLETEAQYIAADLEPVQPGSDLSAVPEPSTIVLMALGLALVAFAMAGKRRLHRIRAWKPVTIERSTHDG